MNERRTQLKARFATGEKRVKKAEDEIRRVSQQRLAELLKLSERVRLEHLEDADLTLADRAKLRRSVAASLSASRTKFVMVGGRLLLRRLFRSLRRRLPVAIATAAIVAPLGAFTVLAWKNTGEAMTVVRPNTIEWRLPSGFVAHQSISPGDRLVFIPESSTKAIARRWFPGQGYATAIINTEIGRQPYR